MKLFEFDAKSLLASIPTMYGFPCVSQAFILRIGVDSQLHDCYAAWQRKAEEGGNVTFKLGHEVVNVKERSDKGVVIEYKAPGGRDGESQEARFDELILAVGESITA